jgi:hypothetical protein
VQESTDSALRCKASATSQHGFQQGCYCAGSRPCLRQCFSGRCRCVKLQRRSCRRVGQSARHCASCCTRHRNGWQEQPAARPHPDCQEHQEGELLSKTTKETAALRMSVLTRHLLRSCAHYCTARSQRP